MNIVIRPIESWPGEETPAWDRTHSRFKASWSRTCEDLERELTHLDAECAVMQIDVTERDCRLDGWLRANARPKSPRVALMFESLHGPLTYYADRFDDWQANIRAIVLTLTALRAVDRYGATNRGEQYTGWAQLPDGAAEDDAWAASVISEVIGRPSVECRSRPAIIAALKATHPDHGGDVDQFVRVQRARAVLEGAA